jgi:Pyrimidine dimer DNA glycosylase
MRMWMVDPRRMCRKHLLGEHVELHMLVGTLRRGRSIAGFLAKRLVEPRSIERRHTALASEMVRRGYRHASPLQQPPRAPRGTVDRAVSAVELARRCPACKYGGMR